MGRGPDSSLTNVWMPSLLHQLDLTFKILVNVVLATRQNFLLGQPIDSLSHTFGQRVPDWEPHLYRNIQSEVNSLVHASEGSLSQLSPRPDTPQTSAKPSVGRSECALLRAAPPRPHRH